MPADLLDKNPSFSGNIAKLTKANVDLDRTTKALVCGTAGTVNFIDEVGNTCTAFPLQAGYHPLRIKRLATGGTADDIWALY